jgi:hypothetical protein
MLYRIACAAIAAVLSGCQTSSHIGDENSPFYVVPAGSRLLLQQELQIPPNSLAAYIQNGRVMQNSEVQHYYPFCKFELNQISATARTVQPDEIVVTKGSQQRLKGATALAAPVMLARRGLHMSSLDNDDRTTMESFTTRMDLRSEKQPDIFRLSCAVWDDSGIGKHVSIANIRQTLSGVFTLILPQS